MANIYEANFLSPNTSKAIDGLVDNTFTFRINAKTGVPCSKYKIEIAQNADNTVIYTQTVTLTSVDYVYDKETLSHLVPSSTMTNGVEYKWYVTVYDPSDLVNGVTSDEVLLKLNDPISLTFTVPSSITERLHLFSFEYTQAQGVPIEYFIFNLYDVNDELLDTSGQMEGGRTSYEFSGLENGKTYKVQATGLNVNNIEFSTTLESFSVSYSQTSAIIKPTVEQNRENSLVTITLAGLKQLTGVASGVYSFINDFIFSGNKGLYLEDDSSYAEWEETITEDFTATVKVQKVSGTGKIVELEGESGELYEVGHNGTSFYFINNGITVFGNARSLPSDVFYIVILPTHVYIKTESYLDKIAQ